VLLNRRRINRWAKYAAAGLAFVFAFTFVTAGVGSGLNVNWMDLWSSLGANTNNSAAANSPEDQLREHEAVLAADPENYDALVGAANQYSALRDPFNEAAYLERAVAVTENADLYRRLATLYLASDNRDDQAAVRALNSLTRMEPNDAQAFLQLGAAQRNLGNDSAAVLAWNRYLELAPEGDMATTVKAQIEQVSRPAGAGTAGEDAGTTEATEPEATNGE
jgi:tetratricopeptide (TPR) repeat protein